MLSFLQNLIPGAVQRTLRREVLAMCLIAFIADNVWSVLSPTFSNFATSLGASLSLVGVLSSLAGLTQLAASMWLGLQSDLRGRKPVIVAGLGVFAISMFMFAGASDAWLLIPARILFGLGTVSIFTIGAAYIGDVISAEERGVAFGLYATSMGLGATTGPFIGALIQPAFGISGTYVWGGLLAGLGAFLAWRWLADTRKSAIHGPNQHHAPALGAMISVLRNPNLLAACLVTLVANTSFIGLIASFFPVYLVSLGLSQSSINGMFSLRALCSTVTRLPAAILSSKTSRWLFLLGALMIMSVVAFLMSRSQSIPVLALLLVCEGIAFGSVLAVGQSFVAEHSTMASRGAAIGMYSTVGSVGSTLSPLMLGIVADSMGIAAVFVLTSVLLTLGFVAVAAIYLQGRTNRARDLT